MKRLLVGALSALLFALVPAAAQADDGDNRGFVMRVNGDVRIGSGETIGSVLVIDGNAFVEGTVEDALVVIDGTATVNGRVDGDITVISGDLDLRSGATVKNVNLIRSDMTRASGATITGDLNERDELFFRGFPAVFGILFWVAMTIAVLVAGLLFAAIGGRQLRASSEALTREIGYSILGAVVVWVGVPILAVIIMFTLIGIPLGIGLLLFLLPALWFLGYITAGARLGLAITGRMGRAAGDHPYAAVALGLLVLQLVGLIPALGWLVVAVAGLWGAGALALVAFRAARGGPAMPAGVQGAEQPAG